MGRLGPAMWTEMPNLHLDQYASLETQENTHLPLQCSNSLHKCQNCNWEPSFDQPQHHAYPQGPPVVKKYQGILYGCRAVSYSCKIYVVVHTSVAHTVVQRRRW